MLPLLLAAAMSLSVSSVSYAVTCPAYVLKLDDDSAVPPLQPTSSPIAAVWVAAASTNLFEDDMPPVATATATAAAADMQMMQGETEHRQIAVRLLAGGPPISGVTVRFSAMLRLNEAGSPQQQHTLPSSALRWRQQGYVNCSKFFYNTLRPTPGMFPDPIFDATAAGVTLFPGVTASLWVSVAIPVGTTAGKYAGTASLVMGMHTLSVVPLRVEVWPIALPPLHKARFTAVMNWVDEGDFSATKGLGNLLAPVATKAGPLTPAVYQEAKHQYWAFMCDHRMPPNKLYNAPAFDFFSSADGRGLADFVMLTNATVNGSTQDSCGQGGARSISLGNVQILAGKYLNYSAAQIAATLDRMAPVIDGAKKLGVLDRVYAYGFDEAGPQYKHAMRQLFGAIKARWPTLRTVATLDWNSAAVTGTTTNMTVNLSLPIDVWVQEAKAFSSVTLENIRQWTGAGREFWMYHCCCYDMHSCMNSMTEWPAAISRVMPWLAVANGGTGWLYYAVNEWLPVAYIRPDSKGYCTEGICSEWANHSAVATRSPANSARTRFNPQCEGFANGNGCYFYPGERGPLSSIRWEALRDGLEDAELLLAAAAHGVDVLPIVRTVISSDGKRDLRPETLETARRKVAKLLIAAL